MPRSLVLPLALGIATLCNVVPAAAQARDYPWCVTSADGLFDCSYVTYEQCQATASGIGGCTQNPRARPEDVYPNQFPPRNSFRERGAIR
jgi:hypothetical protein